VSQPAFSGTPGRIVFIADFGGALSQRKWMKLWGKGRKEEREEDNPPLIQQLSWVPNHFTSL